MGSEKQIEKGISEIVGALTDPIIVCPGGWGDSLPEWMKTAITMERLVVNMGALNGEEPTGTDAEACAYPYTAGLSFPLSHDWTQIYMYIAGAAMRQWNKAELPEDIAVASLEDHQMADLDRLKQWLYRHRTSARLEGGRAERRQKKEEMAAEVKAAQPALFDF